LQDVPVVSPYAIASHTFFKAAADVSAHFGWSKPAVIEDPMHVKNAPFSNPSLGIGMDTAQRLVLDPKQELTVDPRVAGSDKDEMTISHISSRSAIFHQITWATSDSIMAPLIYVGVNPAIVSSGITPGLGKQVYQPTPSCFATQAFNYWRGTMEYTLEFVCSQFHRGKGIIGYEPNADARSTTTANLSLNKQFQMIIDLQETQVITFKVEWGAPREWLECRNIAGMLTLFGSTPTLTSMTDNGFFYFAPFTKLMAPETTSTVQILFSARCLDMKVACPITSNLPLKRIVTESMEVSPNTLIQDQVATVSLSMTSADDKMIALDYIGEIVTSFRTLMKRFVAVDGSFATTTPVVPGLGTFSMTFPIYTTAGITYTSTNITYLGNMFDYLRFAFVGVRGSYRKRLRIHLGSANIDEHAYFNISLDNPTNAFSYTQAITAVSGAITHNINMNRLMGSAVFDRNSNGGLEVEFPFYSNNSYLYAFADDLVGTNPGNDQNFNTTWFRNFSITCNTQDTTNTGYYGAAVNGATGEDFQFMRFQGAPLFCNT